MKQKFRDIDFKAPSLRAIETANQIIDQYNAQGYTLTLRQLYYQHVARGLIPNTEKSYDNLGRLINNARLAGLIDWSAIEDRTRSLQGVQLWNTPAEIVAAASNGFRIDKWIDQPYRFECWIEKEALINVVERKCRELEIDWFACRGYVSASEMYSAAERIAGYIDAGQKVILLHLGDMDPSGVDMTRDIEDRLIMFLDGMESASWELTIDRLALNADQVRQYNPPPNPAKLSDSRADKFIAEHGRFSWELDALEPSVIEQLVEDAVFGYRDVDIWDKSYTNQESQRTNLRLVRERWSDVVAYLERTA